MTGVNLDGDSILNGFIAQLPFVSQGGAGPYRRMCHPRCADARNGRLELQGELKSLGFKLPIIVMTLKGDIDIAVRAMKTGAVDFIEKPFNDVRLLGAINEALAQAPGPARDRESVEAAKPVAKLSPRERQVLDGLVAGRLTKQIAHDLGISACTVEEHPRAHAGAAGNTISRRSGSAGGDCAVGSR